MQRWHILLKLQETPMVWCLLFDQGNQIRLLVIILGWRHQNTTSVLQKYLITLFNFSSDVLIPFQILYMSNGLFKTKLFVTLRRWWTVWISVTVMLGTHPLTVPPPGRGAAFTAAPWRRSVSTPRISLRVKMMTSCVAVSCSVVKSGDAFKFDIRSSSYYLKFEISNLISQIW